MIHVSWCVGRNVLRTLRGRSGFFHAGVNAGVLRRQALFQGLVACCRHIGSGTGRKQGNAKQAASDLDFHSFVYNYYNSIPRGKLFLAYKKGSVGAIVSWTIRWVQRRNGRLCLCKGYLF
jgi:hypothetical protein